MHLVLVKLLGIRIIMCSRTRAYGNQTGEKKTCVHLMFDIL